MPTADAIKERAPLLTQELKDSLLRLRRPDLADQMEALTIRSEERSRADRRRTFFAADSPRRYSVEIDLAHSFAIVDVDDCQHIVAVHLLEDID